MAPIHQGPPWCDEREGRATSCASNGTWLNSTECERSTGRPPTPWLEPVCGRRWRSRRASWQEGGTWACGRGGRPVQCRGAGSREPGAGHDGVPGRGGEPVGRREGRPLGLGSTGSSIWPSSISQVDPLARALRRIGQARYRKPCKGVRTVVGRDFNPPLADIPPRPPAAPRPGEGQARAQRATA